MEDVCRGKLKAVIDNKHVLLPWLVMHAGVSITRYKTVHDGKTACGEDQDKRPSNKMLAFGDTVVWTMPKDNHRRNKMDSIHQFGVFVGIVPRTGELVVLILEGAVVVRTVHRLSEDRKWDTEFVSKVKGALWDFKVNAGDDINDGGLLERVDARPPDPPIEIPPRINVRRMYISPGWTLKSTARRVTRLSESHEENCAVMQLWLHTEMLAVRVS